MGSKQINRRKKIHRRIRKKIFGTAERPRLSVFRSNKGIYAQIINDVDATTIVAASCKEVSGYNNKTEQATAVGQLVAQKAIDAGVKTVIFDRSGYIFHGRVKALAEAARGTKLEDGSNELLQF
jgi:large subunit ribosomal protein L18